ncbi:MAG TPA: hypothetical protein VD968_09325 [Pyrinomonadaceae bacterium]|nr:hypothetical protein [Pyrinomonadaceae bacterium]
MAGGKRKRDSIHETPDVSYITNPDVAHEHTDVPVSPLLKFVAGLTIFTLVICGAMWLMFKYLQGREEAEELTPSPLARQREERLPPEPRLQLAPGFKAKTSDGREVDLAYDIQGPTERAPQPQSEYWVVLADWQHQLHTYGWADEQAGTVRIPVDEAIKRYAAQQQSKQQQQQPGGAQQQAVPGESQPSQSSSGHQAEPRHQ